jgi:hypothetical protein
MKKLVIAAAVTSVLTACGTTNNTAQLQNSGVPGVANGRGCERSARMDEQTAQSAGLCV